jgi:predicted negative regulator of RcsB-dependent stress response
MSVYMTEAEQIDIIKQWWKRYNGVVTVFLSIILLICSGIKYWHWHQDKVIQQASNTYEHLMLAFSNHDNKAVRGYANQLITDYGRTVYADAARLTLAKLYVSHENYDRARNELEGVITHAKMNALVDVARIRLARLLAMDKKFDAALAELDKVNDKVYFSVANELRGDIYSATGRYQEAVAFYRKAMSEVQTSGMGNLFLEMKSNDLAQVMKLKQNPLESA